MWKKHYCNYVVERHKVNMALIHVNNAEDFKAKYIQVMADWDSWKMFNYFFFIIEDRNTLLHVEVLPNTKETHVSFVSFRDKDAVYGLLLHMSDTEIKGTEENISASADAETIINYLDSWHEKLKMYGGEEGLKEENCRRREEFRRKISQENK